MQRTPNLGKTISTTDKTSANETGDTYETVENKGSDMLGLVFPVQSSVLRNYNS